MTTDRGIETFKEGLRRASRAVARRAGEVARGPGARRLRALAVRHPGRAVIVLGTAGWLLALLAGGGRSGATAPVAASSPPPARAAVPPEYATLAGRIDDVWLTSRDGPAEGGDGDAETIAGLRNAALDLAPLRPADPDIAAVVAEARSALDEGAASWERFLALPRPPGVLDSAAEGFVRGLLLDFPGATRQHDRLVGARDDLLAELHRALAALRRIEAAKLMLPRLAARHAGPPREGGPALAVDLDAAWGPIGPDDWLTLTNASGGDLHNATVLVEVRGAAGAVARSVHFVPSWPAGTAIQARYTRGEEAPGFQLNRRTVPDVAALTISIWAEELRQEGIACAYAGAGRDADVARYCAGMSLRARFRPFQAGLLWNTQRGMELWLDGVEFLPNPRVILTFRRGTDARSWYWDFARWDRGERKVLDAGEALPWDPEEVAIDVSFPGTGFNHAARWPSR